MELKPHQIEAAKRCQRCKTLKPAAHFTYGTCKDCCNEASRLLRQRERSTPEGRAIIAARAAKHRATEKGKATKKRLDRKWLESDIGRAKTQADGRARRSTPEGRAKANAAALIASSAWAKNNPDKATAKVMKRYAAKKNRLPAWANLEAIAAFYATAKTLTQATGIVHHVDHIIPLQGTNVSGLHVENNLQVITATANMSKSNTWNPACTS